MDRIRSGKVASAQKQRNMGEACPAADIKANRPTQTEQSQTCCRMYFRAVRWLGSCLFRKMIVPFLDRLQQWAEERPDNIAIVVNDEWQSWSELHTEAKRRIPDSQFSTLSKDNSLEFVAAFSAGIAGNRRCVVLDPQWPPQGQDEVTALLGHPEKVPTKELIDGNSSEPFLIGFTSGTTSVPKAFLRSRQSWLTSFASSAKFFGLTQSDKTLAPGPLTTSLNLFSLAECLYTGSEFHTLRTFDVGAAHTSIVHHGITRLIAVPAMLRMLSERGLMACVDASGITTIICAGSKLDDRTLKATRRWAPNATIFEYYGSSELSFVSGKRLDPHKEPANSRTGIGTAFPGVDIKILDDDGAQLPDGETGNICVRSSMVCEGHLGGEDKTSFQSLGGWHTVWDRGYLFEDELHIVGRRSDTIITGGQNVYPHEVELALTSLPGVSDAIVTGIRDDLRGQRIVAAIIPSCGGLTRASLTAGLETNLTLSKRPHQYFFLRELPLNDHGKVSRPILLNWISNDDPRVRRLR